MLALAIVALPQMILPLLMVLFDDLPSNITYIMCIIPYYGLYIALWRFSIIGYSNSPLTIKRYPTSNRQRERERESIRATTYLPCAITI
jgi:hypothetical protein